MPLSSLLSARNEAPRGKPESNSREKQKSRKGGYERVRDLEPITKERRPKFGAFLFALARLGLVFPLAAFASDLMGIQFTIGLLLGIDLSSVGRMLF